MSAFESRGLEELRRLALETLGAHGDQRAIDALRRAVMVVTPGAAQWQASTGPVYAHRVTLGLDARCLGRLRAAPATVDALCAALAAAIARRPGETLLELELRWTPGVSMSAAGYRDAIRPPISLRDALVEYLEAMGERSLARVIEGARVTPEYPSSVDHASGAHGSSRPPWRGAPRTVLELQPAERDALKTDGRAFAMLARAVRDLLGDARARLDVT